MRLFCTIVGKRGSAFSVNVSEKASLDNLKNAIKKRKPDTIQCEAGLLQLFLAKKNNLWLQSRSEDMEKLNKGETTAAIEELTHEDKELDPTEAIGDLFGDIPTKKTIHVLVLVPSGFDLTIGEATRDTIDRKELEYYQQRGQVIRSNCQSYCEEILQQVKTHYESELPLPFICVEGSSGMGKTQLAFALGGERPYFYWPATRLGDESQSIYKNFKSISDAFNAVMTNDNPQGQKKKAALKTSSTFYRSTELFTYGFIRALLEYYNSRDHQQPQMIRIEEETKFHVDKCHLSTVLALRDKIVADGKVLPFFILDDLSPGDSDEGMKVAAFQRNVLRVCGLVVVVMGTNSKITDLADHSGGRYRSYSSEHFWMTVVPRFPPHQFMMLKCADQQVWDTVVDKYPVVKKISTHSCGRFSRYFVDSVVAYSTVHKDTELYALLDEAFLEVSKQTQLGKRFLSHQIGKTAQLAAISYTTSNAEFESPLKKRKLGKDAVGADCMNVHFENLADEQVTKVVLRHGTLKVNGTCNEWVPRCAFPDVKEDMLLYLAVLGGKTYSCYYDHGLHIAHSTKFIFSEYLASNGLAFSKKTHAVKNDYATFENMVAHAIFCASRRNGVRRICFNHFFAGLLGDLQDEFKPMTLTMADSSETIAASDLLDEFTALTKLANATIPFLAPPNAVWPKCILRADGCNFGHLVRVHDEERCDAFVEDVNRPGTPLFICECKYWDNNVGSDTMRSIIGRLEKLWGEEWAIVVLFCVDFVNLKKSWDHEEIGCVKITLETCCVRWIHQPPEGKKNKLVVVVEMGTL